MCYFFVFVLTNFACSREITHAECVSNKIYQNSEYNVLNAQNTLLKFMLTSAHIQLKILTKKQFSQYYIHY